MGTELCPSAVANAPVTRVWALLTDPERYDTWWDARTVAVEPPGEATQGQIVTLHSRAAGIRWPLTLTVASIDPIGRRIDFAGRFPAGIGMRNRIQCTPVTADRCRIQYG
ncbi:MAG TPA: SRPBCC family protein [Bryobacterales bacterium]|nr:SRPBCC family protein [Bryobacterales bacterium]